MHPIKTIAAAVAAALALHGIDAIAEVASGPSSSQPPYVVPTASGWSVTSLLTVGDTAMETPYRMAGIPDGLGVLAGSFDGDAARYVADKAFMTVFITTRYAPTAASRVHTGSREHSSHSGRST